MCSIIQYTYYKVYTVNINNKISQIICQKFLSSTLKQFFFVNFYIYIQKY